MRKHCTTTIFKNILNSTNIIYFMTNKSDLKRLDLFLSKKPAETLNRFFFLFEEQQLQLQCRKTEKQKNFI